MRGRALVCIAAVAALTACESSTDAKVTYSATMTGAKERPNPVTTNGTGTFTATLDGNILTYNLSFTGLTSNTNGAHIHGPATTEQAVGVLIDFNAASAGRTIVLGATSGTGSGTIDLGVAINATVTAAAFRAMLDNGELYVNIHTVNNGGGEIRGQITKQ